VSPRCFGSSSTRRQSQGLVADIPDAPKYCTDGLERSMPLGGGIELSEQRGNLVVRSVAFAQHTLRHAKTGEEKKEGEREEGLSQGAYCAWRLKRRRAKGHDVADEISSK